MRSRSIAANEVAAVIDDMDSIENTDDAGRQLLAEDARKHLALAAFALLAEDEPLKYADPDVYDALENARGLIFDEDLLGVDALGHRPEVAMARGLLVDAKTGLNRPLPGARLQGFDPNKTYYRGHYPVGYRPLMVCDLDRSDRKSLEDGLKKLGLTQAAATVARWEALPLLHVSPALKASFDRAVLTQTNAGGDDVKADALRAFADELDVVDDPRIVPVPTARAPNGIPESCAR
jgi:hypothetical protein